MREDSMNNPTDARRRVLIWKAAPDDSLQTSSERTHPMATATADGDLHVSDRGQQAIDSACMILEPHCHEPRIAALHSKMREVAHPLEPTSRPGGEQPLEKSIDRVKLLKSAEAHLPRGDQQSRLVMRDLAKPDELEILRQSNPRAAEQWERDHPIPA
jgi:hypothetical protein